MKQTFIILLTLIIFDQAFAMIESRHREYPYSREEQLRVEIDIAFGELSISKGTSEKIAIIDYEELTDASQKLPISYVVEGSTGILRIKLTEKVEIFDEGSAKKRSRRLKLQVNPRLPIDLVVSLGAGKSTIDLSGIQLNSFSLAAGASSVEIQCAIPNPIRAQQITIESGVGKVFGKQLANMNFKELRFEGGVGSYVLNFDGVLRKKGDVKIEVGVGSLVINIPPTTPSIIYHESNWLSSFRIDNDFEKASNNTYINRIYSEEEPYLKFTIESALGSVSIRQR